MIWLVPERSAKYTRQLDRSLYESPPVAMAAVQSSLRELGSVVLNQLSSILKNKTTVEIKDTLTEAEKALQATRDFATPIETSGNEGELYSQKLVAIHLMDHLRRLIERCQETDSTRRISESRLEPIELDLLSIVGDAILQVETLAELAPEAEVSDSKMARMEKAWLRFEVKADQARSDLIGDAAAGREDTATTIRKLDTLTWNRRVSYHVWRIVHYSSGSSEEFASQDLEGPE